MRINKKKGGLGFRDLHEFNIALLTKQAWRLIKFPNSLWARFIKLIYFLRSDFLCSKSRNDSSWGWKSIRKGKALLLKGIRWNVGTGENINILKDPWIPQAQNFCISLTRLIPNDAPSQVSSFINKDNLKWNLLDIANFVSLKDMRHILKFLLVEVKVGMK